MNKIKIIYCLEKALLLNFSIFLIFTPYSERLVKVCFCVAVFIWLALSILKQGRRFYRGLFVANPLNKPILFFLAVAIVSTVFSLDFRHSQSVFFERYLPYVVFLWIGAGIVHPVRCLLSNGVNPVRNKMPKVSGKSPVWISNGALYFLIISFVFSGIIFGAGGVWDYLHYRPAALWTVFGREIAFKAFPLYLVYYIPLSFMLLLFAKRWLRVLGLVSLILLIPCWVWQSSRGAWVAIPLGILIIAFFKNKRLTSILFLVFIAVFFLLFSLNPERVRTIVVPARWSGRVEIWSASVDIFKDFPVFGAGVGMHPHLLNKYAPPQGLPGGDIHLHSHNTYLEVATEMGIIGLLAFLWIFVAFFKNAFKTIKQASSDREVMLLGLTGSILAMLIFALSTTVITVGVPTLMFWFLLGMASGLLKPNGHNPVQPTQSDKFD